jgi:hypothetical protein
MKTEFEFKTILLLPMCRMLFKMISLTVVLYQKSKVPFKKYNFAPEYLRYFEIHLQYSKTYP